MKQLVPLPVYRKFWFLILASAILLPTIGPLSPSVQAQQEAGAEAAENADAAASEDDAATGEEATGEESSESGATKTSFLRWIIEVSGLIGAVLLVLSLYFVATVSQLFIEFRPEVAAPPEILSQCDELFKARDYAGAYRILKADDSFFSTVLVAGLTELPNGMGAAREAMDRAADVVLAHMEKRISMLAVLGSLGPMIGLLGTLKGMIASFSVIALSDTQLKASEVAGGISEALVLTFEGVGLSVPAIYFFAVFRNRVSTIGATTMLLVDDYLRRLQGSTRKTAAPAPTAPPTA